MYYRDDREQLSIEEFFLPFGGRLMKSNRWVCLADIMPWEHIEALYVQNMSEETGRPAIPSRMAFGAVFINAYDHLTDKGAVQSLQENPYMQYFVGLHEFHAKPLFDPSMMVHFRKQFPVEEVAKINEYICTGKWPEEQYRNDEPKAFIPGSGSRNSVSPLAQGPACCDSGGVPPAEDDVRQRHPYLRVASETNTKIMRQIYQDACARNVVEGRNGIAKRRSGLDRLFSKLDETA